MAASEREQDRNEPQCDGLLSPEDLLPDGPGELSPPRPPGSGAGDPLVPEPAEGLFGWLNLLLATLRRNWFPLSLLLLPTVVLPGIGWTMLLDQLTGGLLYAYDSTVRVVPREAVLASVDVRAVSVIAVATLAYALLGAWGWSAAMWWVTADAVCSPAGVVDALAGGARRTLPMLGWFAGYLLVVAVGSVLLLLPGLYLAVTAGLFSFVVVYEPGRNPIWRSFRLVHQTCRTFGRAALLLCCSIAAALLVNGSRLLWESLEDHPGEPLIWMIADGILWLLLSMVTVVGLLLVYTQARAEREPITAAQLWQALPR